MSYLLPIGVLAAVVFALFSWRESVRPGVRRTVTSKTSFYHVAPIEQGVRVRWYYASRPAIEMFFTTQGLVRTNIVPGTELRSDLVQAQIDRMMNDLQEHTALFGLTEEQVEKRAIGTEPTGMSGKRSFDYEGRKYIVEDRPSGAHIIMRVIAKQPVIAALFESLGLAQIRVNDAAVFSGDEIEAMIQQMLMDAYTSTNHLTFAVTRKQLRTPASAEWSAPKSARLKGP